MCMTFIDVESNRSQITCIVVVAETNWMRIQNLPDRIGCGVKKNGVHTPLLSCECNMTRLRIFYLRVVLILPETYTMCLNQVLQKYSNSNKKIEHDTGPILPLYIKKFPLQLE